MADDVSAGRLHIDAYGDTSGFGRTLQAKIDAEVKNVKAKVKVTLDQRALIPEARAAAKTIQQAAQAKIKASIDSAGLVASAKAAATAAAEAAKVKIKADIDQAQFEASLVAATNAMTGRYSVTVNVDLDSAAADARLAAFRERARGIPIKLGMDIQLGNAGQAIKQLSMIPAIAGGVFLLVSALGNVVGGLFAITSAAAQSVVALAAVPNLIGAIGQAGGVLLAGLSGIGGAVTELGQADAAAGTTAAKSADIRVDAAKRIAAAQLALKDAYHQAEDAARAAGYAVKDARYALQEANEGQDAAEQALADAQRNRRRGLRDAEWRLEEAQDSASDAQQRLTDARTAAQKRIDSMHKSLRALALSEALANNNLAKAQQQLQDVLWNAAASPQEVADARLAVAQAQAQLNDVRETTTDLAAESAKADEDGVEGSEQVLAAQEAQEDAARNLMLAEEALRDTRRESARAVAAAQEQIRDANHSVMLSERALAEARHQQADTQRSNARSIAAAQQAVRDAQNAGTQAAQAQSAALASQTTEFDKLSPSAQRFALFLYNDVMPRLREVKVAIQDALLPPLETGIRKAMPLLETVKTGLVGTADVVGRLAIKVGELFGSKGFNANTAAIMSSNNKVLESFGDTLLNIINWLSDIAVVAGPTLAQPFARWTVEVSKSWAEAAKLGRETGTMRDRFIEARERAKQLVSIISNLGGAIKGAGEAAVPAGDQLLDSLDKTAQRWNKWANSDAGQKRMGEFFEATKEPMRALGRLVGSLSTFLVLSGEKGSSPVTALLDTLSTAVSGLNWALNQPYLGTFIGWLLTAAGVAGGVGLLAGMLIKVGTAIGFLSKITGVTAAFNLFRNSVLLARIQMGLANVQIALMSAGSYIAAGASAAWAGATWALGGALAFLTSPIGLVILAVAALAAGFIWAYRNIEGFRNVVDGVVNAVVGAFQWLWDVLFGHSIMPDLVTGMQWVGKMIGLVFGAVTAAIKVVGGWFRSLWVDYIKPAWNSVQTAITTGWNNGIKKPLQDFWQALKDVGGFFRSLWTDYVEVYWGKVRTAIDDGWTKISGWLGSFKEFIKTTLPKAFEDGVAAIKGWWDKLEGYAKTPIKFVVDTVYNKGIVPLVNAIPGVGEIKTIDTSAWATGGVLPGYTPGRDVHRFVSPTGGGLELSGGEAVMRPEWTRAVGKRGVDMMNAAARKGVGAVQSLMGGGDGHADGGVIGGLGRSLRFFLGGIMPLEGGSLTNQHPLPYYDTGATFAGDLNGPYDLRNPPASVYAWKPGTVAHTATGNDSHGRYGNHVVIDHGGSNSWYAHLSSILTSVGKRVSGGTDIGRVGQTGNADGAHLHFETRGGAAPTGSTGGTSAPDPREEKRDSWREVIGKVKDAIQAIPEMVKGIGSGGWGPMMTKSIKSIGANVVQWLNDKIPNNIGPFPLPDNPVPNLFDKGGDWRSGTAGINLSGRTETVMTNENIVDTVGGLSVIARSLRGMVADPKSPAGGSGALIDKVELHAPADKVPEVLDELVHKLRVIQLGGLYSDRATPASI